MFIITQFSYYYYNHLIYTCRYLLSKDLRATSYFYGMGAGGLWEVKLACGHPLRDKSQTYWMAGVTDVNPGFGPSRGDHINRQAGWLDFISSGLALTYLLILQLPLQSQYSHLVTARHLLLKHVLNWPPGSYRINGVEESILHSWWPGLKFNWRLRWNVWEATEVSLLQQRRNIFCRVWRHLFVYPDLHSPLYPDSFCISYVAHRWGFESLRGTRAGRMAQWGKNLLCKYEDPSSDPMIPCKK